jgi:hypothetical protein
MMTQMNWQVTLHGKTWDDLDRPLDWCCEKWHRRFGMTWRAERTKANWENAGFYKTWYFRDQKDMAWFLTIPAAAFLGAAFEFIVRAILGV